MGDNDSLFSAYREKMLEYVFAGECLRRLWKRGIADAELLRADVDGAGYDLVIEVRGVVRHVQLKASFNGSRTRDQTINGKLCEKPSGCVIWIGFNQESMELGPYYWFGGLPKEPLPSLASFKKAKHTKGNSLGVKTERIRSFKLSRTKFERISDLDGLLERMFGPLP